ncbi:hypothetical protein JB92DRAFT_3113872 [Gautieria morchelliformis]|nr:hypothetical protein JB92DRAFT_3113872 [Gautieria morchelliformis]
MPTPLSIPANSQSQGVGTLAPNQTIPPHKAGPSASPRQYLTQATRFSLFGEIKGGASWNLGNSYTADRYRQTAARGLPHVWRQRNRVATNIDLQKAVSDIKEAVASGRGQPLAASAGDSYAAAAKRGLGGTSNQVTIQKQNMIAE